MTNSTLFSQAALTKQPPHHFHFSTTFVFTLFGCNFRKVSRGPSVSLFVDELYAYAVHPDLPVQVIPAILEIRQNRNGNAQLGELVLADRIETGILEGARDRVLPQSRLEVHRVEGAYAAPQTLVFSDYPCHKQWTRKKTLLLVKM